MWLIEVLVVFVISLSHVVVAFVVSSNVVSYVAVCV